jgi:hypothetical protein
MDVAFRNATSGTTLATALPTGNALGDILFAQVYTEGASQPFTPGTATGWTLIDSYPTNITGADKSSTHWYWIARGASAPATNWTAAGQSYSEVSYACYSGADTTTPINVYAKNQDSAAGSTTVAWLTITTTITGCMIVGLGTISEFAATTAAQWTNERIDGAGTSAAHIFDQGTQASGAQSAKSETGGKGWATVQIGLAPSGGGGGSSVAPGMIIPPVRAVQRAASW